MTMQHTASSRIQVCPACLDAINLAAAFNCPACKRPVVSAKDADIDARAKTLGVHTVPSVVIDGRLIPFCIMGGIRESALVSAGIV